MLTVPIFLGNSTPQNICRKQHQCHINKQTLSPLPLPATSPVWYIPVVEMREPLRPRHHWTRLHGLHQGQWEGSLVDDGLWAFWFCWKTSLLQISKWPKQHLCSSLLNMVRLFFCILTWHHSHSWLSPAPPEVDWVGNNMWTVSSTSLHASLTDRKRLPSLSIYLQHSHIDNQFHIGKHLLQWKKASHSLTRFGQFSPGDMSKHLSIILLTYAGNNFLGVRWRMW